MANPDFRRDDWQSDLNAQGEWASTFAWGFAALAALAAVVIWVFTH